MIYFVDTEFDFAVDSDNIANLEVISIALVSLDDSKRFYAVNKDYVQPIEDGLCVPTAVIDTHVLPALNAHIATVDYPKRIFDGILAFIGDDDAVEFWGDYAAFDYVAMITLAGGMHHWPRHWPMFINDLQPFATSEPSDIPHNALCDALAARRTYLKTY